MAAGLQSFQSNDKQMQAIRELTNEVFNLKQKHLTDQTTNNSRLDELEAHKILVQTFNLGVTATEIAAGGVSARLFPSYTTPEGYDVAGVIQEVAYSEGGVAQPLVIAVAVSKATANQVSFILYNMSSEAVTIVGLRAVLIFIPKTPA